MSFGSAKTNCLNSKEHSGIWYLDTPGFADTNYRQVASKAITDALKKNGLYQVFFVLTLSSGRLRPQDMETIRLVLQCTVDITSYTILVNKLSKRDWEGFKTIKKEILNEVTKFDVRCGCRSPCIVPVIKDKKLNDAENKIQKFEHLIKHTEEAEWVKVNPDSVTEIQEYYDSFKQNNDNLMNATACLGTTSKQMGKSKNEAVSKRQIVGFQLDFSSNVSF